MRVLIWRCRGLPGIVPALCIALPSCAYEHTGPGGARAELESAALWLTGAVDTGSLILRNSGGSPLHWRIANGTDWLTVPDSGIVHAGAEAALLMRARTDAVPAGDHIASAVLKSNHFGPPIPFDVHLHIEPAPVATLTGVDTVAYPLTTGALAITNTGKGLLTWRAHSTAPWLTLTVWEGTLEPRQTGSIGFHIDRDATPSDTAADVVIESDDAGSPLTVEVNVLGIPAPSVTILPGPVIASAATGIEIQAVIGNSLMVINTENGTITSIPLPQKGTGLSATTYLTVVAHDSAYSIVNVETGELERFVPLDFEVAAVYNLLSAWIWLVPRASPTARLVRISMTDPSYRQDIITEHPPIHDVLQGVGFGIFAAYDGGLLRYESMLQYPHFQVVDVVEDVPFAPGRIRIWQNGNRILTSAGALVAPVNDGELGVTGILEWQGAAPGPIRTVQGDRFIVRDSLDGQPALPQVWDYDGELTVTPTALPPVEWNGQLLTAEPHMYVRGPPRESRFVIQQALTSDGMGPWMLLQIYY